MLPMLRTQVRIDRFLILSVNVAPAPTARFGGVAVAVSRSSASVQGPVTAVWLFPGSVNGGTVEGPVLTVVVVAPVGCAVVEPRFCGGGPPALGPPHA